MLITNITLASNVNFLIDFLKYLNIYLTNSFYLENSHLAMMIVAVFIFFQYLYYQIVEDYIFLFLLTLSILITLNNLSTTFL